MKISLTKFILVLALILINVSAIDWCEDIEDARKKMGPNYKRNPLAPPDKCIKRDTLHKKKFALFPIANDPAQCNFWNNATKPILVAPWPKNCMIY